MSTWANRWLTWQPKQEGKTEPSRPTEPRKPAGEGGFVGFEGRGEGPFPFIEGQAPDSGRVLDLRIEPDSTVAEPTQPTAPFLRIKRKSPWGEPTKPTNPPSLEDREAALVFVNRAAARLVCPDCFPDLPSGARYAIAVPTANDDAQFRDALRVLRMDQLPVIRRILPLGFRPEVEHRRRIRWPLIK